MITIGVDAHKRLHVAIAIDESGREVGSWQGDNSRPRWEEFLIWSQGFEDERHIGIEGAWNYGRGLAQHLVRSGEVVYEVNARWTALGRRSARRLGKTDLLDAMAIALFVQRESTTLTAITAEDDTAILDLLTVERDSALAEATRLRNQLHALLLHLDPEYERELPTLKSQASMRRLLEYQTTGCSSMDVARAATVRRLAARLHLALEQARETEDQIKSIAAINYTALTELCGISLLTAGALAGLLGPGRRFRSDAALAAYAGVAPLEASSAGRTRHRLNRGGNRRLNAILYRIALTQSRWSPEAKDYLARRIAEGKTRREALRALKRFLVRAIWRLWTRCTTNQVEVRKTLQEATL